MARPDIGKDLKKVRNVKPLWSRFGTIAAAAYRRTVYLDQHFIVGLLRYAQGLAALGTSRAHNAVIAMHCT